MTIPKSYEALAADLASEKIISKTMQGQKEAYMILADKGRLDLSESKAREDALREELDKVRDLHSKQCCVFCNDTGNLRSVHTALQQRLTVAEQRADDLSVFSKEMIDAAFEGGSLDGAEIQDIAVKHGLLKIENRTEECGDVCACREFGFPSECYRKTDLSALKPSEGEGS